MLNKHERIDIKLVYISILETERKLVICDVRLSKSKKKEFVIVNLNVISESLHDKLFNAKFADELIQDDTVCDDAV